MKEDTVRGESNETIIHVGMHRNHVSNVVNGRQGTAGLVVRVVAVDLGVLDVVDDGRVARFVSVLERCRVHKVRRKLRE